VTEWDEGAEMLFGYASDEALERPVAELIVPPELRSVHTRGLRRVAAGGRSALAGRTVEVPALDVFGRRFLVELTIAEVDAAPTRFVGTITVVGTHTGSARPVSAER